MRPISWRHSSIVGLRECLGPGRCLGRNCCRSNWASVGSSFRLHARRWRRSCFAVDRAVVSLRAVPADVSSLAAAVARLAALVQRTTIGGSAVPADVTKFAASVALLIWSLTVTCKVVRTAALVAHSRTTVASIATTEATTVASTWRTACPAASRSSSWARTVALRMSVHIPQSPI